MATISAGGKLRTRDAASSMAKGMPAKARDNLSLRDLDLTVYYRVAPAAIADLTVKYAGQHLREDGSRVYLPALALIQRLARNAIYEQTSHIDSLVMHTQRAQLAASLAASLSLLMPAAMPCLPSKMACAPVKPATNSAAGRL